MKTSHHGDGRVVVVVMLVVIVMENLREKAGRQDRLKEYKFKVNFALG